MDDVTATIAAFAASVDFDSLDDVVVGRTIRHHLDAIGCAAGGFASEPCRIGRALATAAAGSPGCSVYGVAERSTPDYAALVNGSHVRHLDYNDAVGGLKLGVGHPSDMVPAVFAAAELTGSGGRDVIVGMFVAYEIFVGLADAAAMRDRGWDQGAQTAIATAAAAGRVIGLSTEQIANAVAIACTAGLPLRVVRTGELSHWKGCAAPYGTMTGMLAAQLARAGMTGPPESFAGPDGFFDHTGGPFRLDHLGSGLEGRSAVERTLLKFFPAEGNSLGPLTALLELRHRLPADEIVSLVVRVPHLTWHEIGGGQGDVAEKWDPQTRETADHSLPYLLAVALIDGTITFDSFTADRIADPALRPLMRKISIEPDEEMSARLASPEMFAGASMEIRLAGGEVIVGRCSYSRGHPENPMSDDEIEAKFMSMAPRVQSNREARRLGELLWSLDRLDDLDELAANFRAWSDRTSSM